MIALKSRLGEGAEAASPALCDLWLAEGERVGDEIPGLDPAALIGAWPDDLETDAAARLAETVGDEASWSDLTKTPPVAQKLAERARLQPLDIEILRHIRHLKEVCHRPRLHLRVEEERVAVSRARRTPVRAVADLVSHPGDWEHRTLRSIQPSRVLARLVEDEWNLYENRVAVRLVDHLLAYLAKRLEELRKIEEALRERQDYSDEARTSHWRASRVTKLWADALTNKTEEALRTTIRKLEAAQRDLQSLMDAPLYKRVPSRLSVAISLKPTNILINDPHYRKVAVLWRAWAKYGHRRQETRQERAARRRREAAAWDQFVFHLVVRALTEIQWSAEPDGDGWRVERDGWLPVDVLRDENGVIRLARGDKALRLLPLCATLSGALAEALTRQLSSFDHAGDELVIVHVGAPAPLPDSDRAAGWSFGGRAVLLGCSPWAIDAEERMARLLGGWLGRAAVRDYPFARSIRALPELPKEWGWLTYRDQWLVAFRPPDEGERGAARSWAATRVKELEVRAQQARVARQADPVAPHRAMAEFQKFLEMVEAAFGGIEECPVCGASSAVDGRPGKNADGSDATWWARCSSCGSERGTRPCTACGARYRALAVGTSLDLAKAAETIEPRDWPDKLIGRDVWAQPCRTGIAKRFRCPDCGRCSGGACARCHR